MKMTCGDTALSNHALCLFLTLIQASSKVEVDPDATEKLKVTRGDFLNALANDVKPVSAADCSQNAIKIFC